VEEPEQDAGDALHEGGDGQDEVLARTVGQEPGEPPGEHARR
jgi:hypothetical protein